MPTALAAEPSHSASPAAVPGDAAVHESIAGAFDGLFGVGQFDAELPRLALASIAGDGE
jgi:hypothetical protein